MHNRGAYYQVEWLLEVCNVHVAQGQHIFAVRSFLLLLLGMSIFCNKTGTRVEAKWLLLLEDINQTAHGCGVQLP